MFIFKYTSCQKTRVSRSKAFGLVVSHSQVDIVSPFSFPLADTNSTPLKLCTALLESGADVNSADHKQRNCLHYSVNCTTGGFETITEVEDVLIKYGANTVALDLHNRIPLHYAFVKMNSK